MQTTVIKPQYIAHCWRRACDAGVLCVQHSLYESLHITTSRWELQKICCVVIMNEGVGKKTRTVCDMYRTGERVSSWDIWLHQLEFLYCCCDKWLYSQFASFCFSALLDCSPASSSPRVYLCRLSTAAKKLASSYLTVVLAPTHAGTIVKLKSGQEEQEEFIEASKSNSYPKTYFCVTISKQKCIFSEFQQNPNNKAWVCFLSSVRTLWHTDVY